MFQFITSGESHGPCLTAIVQGLPAGLKIDINKINAELARRQKGYGRGGRMAIETDKAEIVSGVRFKETLGSPITLVIKNKDWENWVDKMSAFGEPTGEKVTAPRPGHADLTGIKKYNRQDIRDILERSSARETTARVAAGAVAKEFLRALNIKIGSHIVNIGGVKANVDKVDYYDFKQPDSILNCLDKEAEAAMKCKIKEAADTGNTLGGVFEIVVNNLPIGLGSHIQWNKRLDGLLAQAIMGIQAIKGVEIGAGFNCANLPGSEIHDEIFYDKAKGVYRSSNNAGGLEGGMTNGEPLVIRGCMKPIPTLMTPLHSIDIRDMKEVLANKERSDVCAVLAASVVAEAMVALTLTKAVIEKFGGDAMVDVLANLKNYNERIAGYDHEN